MICLNLNKDTKKKKKDERAKRKEAKHQTMNAEILALIELRQNQALMRTEYRLMRMEDKLEYIT